MSRDSVRNRVYNLKWSIDRAIFAPIRRKPIINHTMQDVNDAIANGIGYHTFYGREVTLNWPVERAKSEQPQVRNELTAKERDTYKMDWNKRINELQNELATMASLKTNCESVIALRREIKRFEVFAKVNAQ